MAQSILIVDDDIDILSILTFALESRGFRVRKAQSAEESLQIVQKFVPDIFLLDISLPGIDGLELCRRLRAQARTRHVPVIFLTARDQPEVVVKGFEAGGDDYVVKPFNMQELLARIENLLRRAREAAPPEKARQGRVIAVTSARGGVGKTTLAVNLALCLTRMWSDEVLLIDHSLEFGRAGVFLDLPEPRTMTALLQEEGEDLERDYIEETYLTAHPSGLRFLAGPPSPAEVDAIGPQEVAHLLQLLRPAFGYIVLDMASSIREPYRSALRLADLVVVVINPEIATLVSTQSLLQNLLLLGVPSEAVQVVLNDYPRTEGSPTHSAIETFLGLPLAGVIPSEPTLPAALNAGRPPVLEQNETPWTQALVRTAYFLSTSLREK